MYNLPNGVSSVTAEGKVASMNADLGQQWVLPTAAISFKGSDVPKQTLKVDIKDVDGKSSGTYLVELDPDTVKNDCFSGKWASVAAATGTALPESKAARSHSAKNMLTVYKRFDKKTRTMTFEIQWKSYSRSLICVTAMQCLHCV